MQEQETQCHLDGVVVVLDNLRSAFNVGSIFRTCEACGVEKIYLCGITAKPPNQKLDKTALGAIEFVPWEYRRSTHEALNEFKKAGIPVLCVEVRHGSTPLWNIPLPRKVAFVFGHEIWGISEDVLSRADDVVHLPMHGIKNSLNVGTACGVVLFEALRRRKSSAVSHSKKSGDT